MVLETPIKLLHQQNYINGEWSDASSGATLEVRNPANGELIGTVPDCSREDVARAIDAANAAWGGWRDLTAKERGTILRNLFNLILEHIDDLARIMTIEQGKPLAEARGEVTYGASFVEWFAEEAKRLYGDTMPSSAPDRRFVVIKQPIGVTAAITPWNFPLAMITRKAAPALAAGCPMVVKPSNETPYSALALCELAERAGFPPGVLSVVTGNARQVGLELTTNPIVRKFSFTGSTAVGKTLMQQCSGTIKKVSLELGGNAPFIVFDDADLDAAVTGAMQSKFRNSGQTCVCANRILVQDGFNDAFVERMGRAVAELKVGNGLDDGTQQGPLISESAIAKVDEHLHDALQKGARLVTGGQRIAGAGTFYQPTLVADVTSKMAVAREETFGPLAPVFRFRTESEAIAMANDTEFGLAAYVFTRDIGRVWRVSERLEYGMVSVNAGIFSTEVAPFGGVKESGIGREGSKYGIDDFVELKYICMAGI